MNELTQRLIKALSLAMETSGYVKGRTEAEALLKEVGEIQTVKSGPTELFITREQAAHLEQDGVIYNPETKPKLWYIQKPFTLTDVQNLIDYDRMAKL